jgi:hypothetical protein
MTTGRNTVTGARFAALLLTGCVGVGDALAQSYHAVEPRPLAGQLTAAPHDINNQLQIVGVSGDQICVWTVEGKVRALGIAAFGTVVINN